MTQRAATSGESLHIAFFGLRNAGKSSLVNAVTGQQLSIISDVKGTTTDPVKKAMELLPIGPVVIIDTPGIDDEGELGVQRVQRSLRILDETDFAVLVSEAGSPLTEREQHLVEQFQAQKIPYLIAWNKSDLLPALPAAQEQALYVSARTGSGVRDLKERIAAALKPQQAEKHIVSDLLQPGDLVVLVTPIDDSAPKGRLILPQQQTIRDLLDSGSMCVVTQPKELPQALSRLKEPPAMVITDSQAFAQVNRDTPEGILLTSFSILFARYKGDLETVVHGAFQLDRLKDGDRVLISEGCTHHRQCGDIGTEKLPNWIRKHTGKAVEFSFTSGGEFPTDLSDYALVVHCGGCMLNEREMKSRLRRASEQGVPVTNYGIAIAQLHGILERSLSPFPDLVQRCRDLPTP